MMYVYKTLHGWRECLEHLVLGGIHYILVVAFGCPGSVKKTDFHFDQAEFFLGP